MYRSGSVKQLGCDAACASCRPRAVATLGRGTSAHVHAPAAMDVPWAQTASGARAADDDHGRRISRASHSGMCYAVDGMGGMVAMSQAVICRGAQIADPARLR